MIKAITSSLSNYLGERYIFLQDNFKNLNYS